MLPLQEAMRSSSHMRPQTLKISVEDIKHPKEIMAEYAWLGILRMGLGHKQCLFVFLGKHTDCILELRDSLDGPQEDITHCEMVEGETEIVSASRKMYVTGKTIRGLHHVALHWKNRSSNSPVYSMVLYRS
jgi:hypothetical protein